MGIFFNVGLRGACHTMAQPWRLTAARIRCLRGIDAGSAQRRARDSSTPARDQRVGGRRPTLRRGGRGEGGRGGRSTHARAPHRGLGATTTTQRPRTRLQNSMAPGTDGALRALALAGVLALVGGARGVRSDCQNLTFCDSYSPSERAGLTILLQTPTNSGSLTPPVVQQPDGPVPEGLTMTMAWLTEPYIFGFQVCPPRRV